VIFCRYEDAHCRTRGLDMDLSFIGEVKEVFTLVDYYTYIKSMEYLICVAFFVGFPMFYRYINGREKNTDSDTEP
jgi:hypothetical protein